MEEKQDNPAPEQNASPAGPLPTDVAGDVSNSMKSAKSGMKRPMMMIAIIVVLVVAAFIALLVMNNDDDSADETATNTSQAEQTPAVVQLGAAITIVEGNVQHSSNGETWTDADGGESINELDYVRTLADSRAVILLDDGSAVRLDAESEMQLTVSDSNTVEIMLNSGQVYTRVTESETRTFAVVTERERFEAQGTAYKTSASDDVDGIEVYQSSVKVDSDGTEVNEGNKYDTETKEKESLDLDALEDDDFVQWNKQKDSENDDYKDKLGVLKDKEEEPEESSGGGNSNSGGTPSAAGISLSGSAVEGGIALNWSLNGVSANDGFKIVRAQGDSTPSYGVDKSVYVGKETRSYTLDTGKSGTFYVRVCAYRASSGSCDSYSNAIQATVEYTPPEAVEPGAVTLSIDGKNISWSIAGTAPHGFKVVLNESGTPTYPANSIQYVGPGSSSTSLPEKTPGTYYVRVCKYTADAEISGGCTDYSNQVKYVVEEEGGEE